MNEKKFPFFPYNIRELMPKICVDFHFYICYNLVVNGRICPYDLEHMRIPGDRNGRFCLRDAKIGGFTNEFSS